MSKDRIILDFQSEIMKARGEQSKIFKELKEKLANLEFCFQQYYNSKLNEK